MNSKLYLFKISTGRKMKIEHFCGEKRIGYIIDEDNYNYDFQKTGHFSCYSSPS